MKCKNPECENPSLLETLGEVASEFEWCPKCGASTAQSTQNVQVPSSDMSDSNITHWPSITIVFHALLAPHFNLNRKKDRISVRGETPFAGWNDDQLEMETVSELPDGYFLIQGKATIPLDALTRTSGRISYKYVVFKTDNKKGSVYTVYEELLDCDSQYGNAANRCLAIPDKYRKENGTWHQYDDVIYSSPKFFESMRKWIPFVKLTMDPVAGRYLAMQAMLPDLEFGPPTSTLPQGNVLLDTIFQVMHCMDNAQVEKDGNVLSRTLRGFKVEEAIQQYIMPKLKKNSEVLPKNEKVQAQRLATSLVIVSICATLIKKYDFQQPAEECNALFGTLALYPSSGRHKIQKIMEILRQYFSKNDIRSFIDAIQTICQYAINKLEHNHRWLLAIPMMHFLTEASQPFTKDLLPLQPTNDDKTFWTSANLDFRCVPESLISVLSKLKPMFNMDPLLRRTFLLALPLSCLGMCAIESDLPHYEICWTLAEKLKAQRINLEDTDKLSVQHCLNEMLNALKNENLPEELEPIFIQELISLARATRSVIDTLLSAIKQNVSILCGFLALLGNVLSIIEAKTQLVVSPKEIEIPLLEDVAAVVKHRMKEASSHVLKYSELEIWISMLSIDIPDSTLQSTWQDKFLQGLKNRVQEMDGMDKIDFYVNNDLGPLKAEIKDLFQDAAFDAFRNIIEVGDTLNHQQAYKKLSTSNIKVNDNGQLKKVGKMMSIFLERYWPKDNADQEPLLRHVLTWSPMADYLRMRHLTSGKRSSFSEKSIVCLACAESCLEDVRKKIYNSSISVKMLRVLQENMPKFLEIMSFISSDKNEEVDGDSDREDSKFKEVLDERLEELKAFNDIHKNLDLFLKLPHSIVKNVNTQAIREKLNTDVSKRPIGELAVQNANHKDIDIVFFKLPEGVTEMVCKLNSIFSSHVFQGIWKSSFSVAKSHYSRKQMTLEMVAGKVWNPSFTKCHDLLKAVLSGEMPLADVDTYFGTFRNRHIDLEKDLLIIARVCGVRAQEKLKIGDRVRQIKLYHQLQDNIDAADKILEFKSRMDLDDGDFTMVEDFRNQISSQSRQNPLKCLDSSRFQEVGNMLHQITKEKMECLDAVMESKNFIDWLKKEVPEQSEVKVLVDLAMISAGEGDMESDRISALHTSTRAFKPIIYDLKKNDGFKELMELCHGIWEVLKENPNLPDQLRDTSRNLQWIMNVKDFHGSAAMSSPQQVETILDHGILTIGHNSNNELVIEHVISVRIPNDKVKGLQKETYTLEELKDLQSKLMLIAGKPSGDLKEKIDKFNAVLQGAITLGKVYLNLCEAGEVSHLEWKEEFHCASRSGRNDVTVVLKETTDDLTKYLEAWTDVLETQRMECNELNYFTAKQLLYLRKEIAVLKKGRDFESLEVQVYALLKTLADSNLPGVTSRELRQALIAIDINVDDQSRKFNLRETYSKFFKDNESAFSEKVIIAAIVACDCPDDTDELLLWCTKNQKKDNDIDVLYEKGSRDPKFETLYSPKQEEAEVTEVMETEQNSYVQKLDQTLRGRYLSLQDLSTLLKTLKNDLVKPRPPMSIPKYLRKGIPNLMIVPQNDILATIIGLYRDSNNVRPTRHEVLICTQDTTVEEIELLWRRVLANKGNKVYCLANVDNLKLDDCVQAKKTFDKLEKEYEHNDDYQLVLICSSEQETKSYMATAFDKYRNTGLPRCPRPSEVLTILQGYFKAPPIMKVHYGKHIIDWIPAADVKVHISDDARLSVLMISSQRAGTGKSLLIQGFVEQLDKLTNNRHVKCLMRKELGEHVTNYIIAPLFGKTVNVSETVGFLLPYSLKSDVPVSRIFHFDVSPSMEFGLDTLLFNLLFLGSIQDKLGRVWNRSTRDLYVIEMTLSEKNLHNDGNTAHHHFYDELPSVQCITPRQALGEMQKTSEPKGFVPLYNDRRFRSEAVQSVFQYLRQLQNKPEGLNDFRFDPNLPNVNAEECLCLLINQCGVNDPSWSELQYFVDFLNYQLSDFEQSVFCKRENIKDALVGFPMFVVEFMTIMSQDFSTRSLEEVNNYNRGEAEGGDGIVQFQLRRKWENSPHPYLFFNPDHETFTFLGFIIDGNGNLIDPAGGKALVKGLMPRQLRAGLAMQRVNFQEHFEDLKKLDKIAKICRVLGVEWPSDPDESYELTEDNAKKMLAIHMRFRCGIPVVIMGETGCGKTKLIRYLCGLQSGHDGPKNMLLVKVHGGTTFSDVEKKVQQAKEMAKKNIKKNIETILFFDEVNTTEAIDLVKEVMVDRRLNGRPLGDEAAGLRFIAACNPYRKHTETMIKKLESAGLGYSVKSEDTKDKIGRVPLRHLVYRVHALPESMRLLIWDFGQLKPEIEILYTRQIVRRHVTLEGNGIPGDENLVEAITTVLAESQRFMREQKDECGFVSLRDVERTMNVMVWFYEHRNVLFGPLQEEQSQRNKTSSVNLESENGDYTQDNLASKANRKGVEKEIEAKPSTKSNKGIQVKSRFKKLWGAMKHPKYRTTLIDDDDDDDGDDDVDDCSVNDISDVDHGKDNDDAIDDTREHIDPITWSLILAIGVCYHAKLQEREQYRQQVAKAFRCPCTLYGGADRILQEISRCQEAMLKDLDLGPNIARNTALSENVFMMVVCIELRIPLFVIGKPGSSKSLAKTVVAANMQGDASKSKLFKSFKEVQMSAHQCSPLSTPEGIHETFRQCSNLQRDKNPDRFASVVVLDEVGLAEDSPLLPLKTLHPLLEDGVTSSDGIIETDDKPKRVAFIGISNWALDPAKMNRGIMLSRDIPGLLELEKSAMGICASQPDVQERMARIIPSLAKAYLEVYETQKNLEVLNKSKKDEFFGLRDFYSLIKMTFCKAKDIHFVPGWDIVEYAVRRNFGGLQDGGLDPVEIFRKHMDVTQQPTMGDDGRKFSPLALIKSSLDKDPSEEDSRYLLILTENHAALSIVQQYLYESRRENDDNDPVLIFGSNFPKDLEYTHVCRNINDIKVCMETGRTVILLNMERLYEGLYDALNQYYVHFGGNKYVDLGLGTHRVKCRVDPKFRLIVIAEKTTVYNDFPIPLINRLEKHFLVLSASLSVFQEELVETLRIWVKRFAKIHKPQYHGKTREFTKGDAFVGYHEDTIPSVVLQVCSHLGQDGTTLEDNEQKKYEWELQVLEESKRLLVQCCTPDAIVRLRSSDLRSEADDIWNMYFEQQHHSSLAEFLKSKKRDEGLLIQVSTHSRMLSEDNLDEVARAINVLEYHVASFTLEQFQTELEFCDKVGTFFVHLGGEEGLLVVQCIPEDTSFNLLACARHLLMKQRAEFTEDQTDLAPIHIIVIIQLPRIPGGYPDFVGFQGQRWECVHIDELATPSFYVPSLEDVKDQSLSELFEASIMACNGGQSNALDAVGVLRQCVQAAAQRINDGPNTVDRATRRIVILLDQLSEEIGTRQEHGDDIQSFSRVMINRVHELLKEKDERTNEQGKKWSTTEAMEHSDLQETGTYRRALWRKIQNAIVPILSELITYIDTNGNLELLQKDIPWLTVLWLQLFQNNKLTEIKYSFFLEENTIRSHVPVTSSGRDGHVFQCMLPFSWLIKEKVDDMWEKAKGIAENTGNYESVDGCLRGLISNSDVSVVVGTINKREEAVERYIRDFIHINYKPLVDGEDRLVRRAILITARQLNNEVVCNTTDFTFPDVALVHKAYSHIEHRLACFSHLVRCQPSIVPQLLNVFNVNEIAMTLDAIALQIIVESLEPLKVNMGNLLERKEWCDHVISVRAPAESMMDETKDFGSEEKTKSIITRCRPLWERITAIRLLIEHVYSHKGSGYQTKLDSKHITQLCKALDEETNFSKARSIQVLEQFLLQCNKSYSRTSKGQLNEFRRRWNAFFMEVISLLCFGRKVKRFTLDSDVFDIFMRYITGKGSSRTKNFSPFPDFEIDETPVVRSFLLQQLLTTSNEDVVKRYIQQYLTEALKLSSDKDHYVIRLCQLAVDCIEDSISTELTEENIGVEMLMKVSKGMIKKYGKVLAANQDSKDQLNVNVLEAISNIRHVLGLTAEWLFKRHVSDDVLVKDLVNHLDDVLKVVQELITRLKHRAPFIYLLKQLARRYGGPVVRELIQKQDIQRFIPRELDGCKLCEPDRFIAHGKMYADIRDALADALISGNFDGFLDISKTHNNVLTLDVLCLLAVYRKVTCGYRQPKNTELPNRRELLQLPAKLSMQARELAAKLLDNSQGEGFVALSAQPNQPQVVVDLAEVVVHTMIVLQCCNDSGTISTLRSLMEKPETMKNSFLPTMPQDDFEKVRKGLRDNVTWYECPAGHRYSIGECGGAVEQSSCPECKQGIGGTGYLLLAGNKILSAIPEDRSGRGHILGNANRNIPEVRRDGLSPAAFHIIRLIMHSSMLVGSCRHPKYTAQLFTPAVAEKNLSKFVWEHLIHDLRRLAAALNRSEDEALLTVHCVLGYVTKVCAKRKSHFKNGVLNTPDQTKQWEKEFTLSFIDPVLSKLDEKIRDCFTLMAERQSVGSDAMREIYEVDSETFKHLHPMHPCFWRYRGKITVEHAKQMFSEKMVANKNSEEYEVLDTFFREELKLRLAQYIPDIYKLQRFLIVICSRRMDLKKAEEMTIKKFKESLNDSKQRELESLLKTFRSAWLAVRSDLDKQGRFKLPSETCRLSMNDDESLSYILPSVGNGHQSCTTSVLFYLVRAHNEFLEAFYNFTDGSASTVLKIPGSEITTAQMLCYDSQRDLLPIIHTHCQYSLEVGQGTKVDYDWSAIQHHVTDRLIRGKSLIVFKEAQFAFLEQDGADKFRALRAKIPQEIMPMTEVKPITTDLRNLDDVCDVKQTLELAIGFLGNSGGDPRQSISKYLHDVLRIPHEKGLRNKRAEGYCELRHIIHLWQVVTSKRAQLLRSQNSEDPFQNLPECFKVPLEKRMTLELNKQLNRSLKSTGINQSKHLEWKLIEIITLALNNKETLHLASMSLQDYLEYLDEKFAIPEEIQMKHIVDVWEELAVKKGSRRH